VSLLAGVADLTLGFGALFNRQRPWTGGGTLALLERDGGPCRRCSGRGNCRSKGGCRWRWIVACLFAGVVGDFG